MDGCNLKQGTKKNRRVVKSIGRKKNYFRKNESRKGQSEVGLLLRLVRKSVWSIETFPAEITHTHAKHTMQP